MQLDICDHADLGSWREQKSIWTTTFGIDILFVLYYFWDYDNDGVRSFFSLDYGLSFAPSLTNFDAIACILMAVSELSNSSFNSSATSSRN